MAMFSSPSRDGTWSVQRGWRCRSVAGRRAASSAMAFGVDLAQEGVQPVRGEIIGSDVVVQNWIGEIAGCNGI